MSKKIRIGTFNVENLFARFNFKKEYPTEQLVKVVKEGWEVDKTRFIINKPVAREITAKAIKALKADILALQEVENIEVLKRFNSKYLGGRYRYKLVIGGNDLRLIDVGILSKYPFRSIRTHQFDKESPSSRKYIFSRDCLEVDLEISENTVLPIFVNHLKSMYGGRQKTMARRKIQAERVVQIIKERFGENPIEDDFIILGDLNDYLPSPGLEPLLCKGWVEDIVATRIEEEDERWTHYWADGNEYKQLDYILLSKSLAEKNLSAVPVIERRGLPLRATKYEGKRFENVGKNDPKASDHCPVMIEINM